MFDAITVQRNCHVAGPVCLRVEVKTQDAGLVPTPFEGVV